MNLPISVFSIVSSYFDMHDLISCSLTSKQLLKATSKCNGIYERECRNTFSSTLELYRKRDLLSLMDDTHDQNSESTVNESQYDYQKSGQMWKKLLREGYILRKEWTSEMLLEKKVLNYTELRMLMEKCFEALREPEPVAPKIQRIEGPTFRKTEWQDFMAEYIYTEQDKYEALSLQKLPSLISMPSLTSEEGNPEETLDKLVAIPEYFVKEVEENMEKSLLFDLRWYIEGSNGIMTDPLGTVTSVNPTYDESQYYGSTVISTSTTVTSSNCMMKMNYDSQPQSFVLRLYNALKSTVTFHCKLVYEILTSCKESEQMVEEYCTRWSAFTTAMITLNQTFGGFNSLMNSVYESVWKGYPCYPKFSVLRLMMFVWRREVYDKVSDELQKHMVEIVGDLHKRLMEHGLNKKTSLKKKLSTNASSAAQAKQKSEEGNNSQQLIQSILDTYNNFGDVNFTLEQRSLLSRIIQCCVDMSINEFSVHYLGSSKLVLETPYMKLHETIYTQTKKFYQTIAGKLPLNLFTETVYNNMDCMKELFTLYSEKELEALRIERVGKYLEHILEKKFGSFISTKQNVSSGSDTNASNKRQNNMMEFIVAYEEILETPFGKFVDNLLNKQAICQAKRQKLMKEFYMFIATEEENLLSTYNNMHYEYGQFTLMRGEEDASLEKYKTKRGIPLSLEKEEKMLYSFIEDVSFDTIDNIYQEYLAKMQLMQNEQEYKMEEEKLEDIEEGENFTSGDCGFYKLPELENEQFSQPMELDFLNLQRGVSEMEDEEEKVVEDDFFQPLPLLSKRR